MRTLVITVNGPFAYFDDAKKGTLRLMAPMCPQHLCVISSIEAGNQFVIWKYNSRNHPANFGGCLNHEYELKFKRKSTQPTKEGNFLPCQPPSNVFNPKHWRFWLSLPRPNVVVAIDPVAAEIDQGGTIVKGSFAIGARLIYKKWDGKAIPLLYRGGPAKYPNGDTVIFKLSTKYDNHAYLDIDFSSPLRDDLDHEDAVSCFEHLMSALDLKWSMFVTTKGNTQFESSKLNDCRAAVVLIG